MNILKIISVIPFAFATLIITVVIGVFSGMPAKEIVSTINNGFGEVLGYLALILIPSFIMASAISQANQVASKGALSTMLAPFAGAAMLCPDTAYAVLSPD